MPKTLPARKALTARKGHAASVRRQSRQRLRSERRYRRNWFVRFYRHLVRTGSAFPRLHPKGTSSRCALRAPRRAFALPAMTNLGAIAFLTLARTSRRCAAGRGQPGPYNMPSMAPQNAKNRGCRIFRHPRSGLTYRTVPWRGRGGRPRSGSSAAPRGPRCRWFRRRSCRRSYPHRRAPWQPRSACRASAP